MCMRVTILHVSIRYAHRDVSGWPEYIPLLVNSGYRCSALNKSVGCVPTSQHLLGQAADIHCSLDTKYLYYTIGNMVTKGLLNVGQCIWYRKSNFVHVSLPTNTLKNQFIIRNK